MKHKRTNLDAERIGNTIVYTLLSCIVMSVLMSLSSCSKKTPKRYFIDSEIGDNNNSGLTAKEAWQNLERVNQNTFAPGDTIFFKSGTTYKGQLKPKGLGKKGNPIVIMPYGKGAKPRIDAEGKYKAALLLENIAFWEVNNLELTNKGETREAGRRGAVISAENFGDCEHIYLNGLEIHDVNGSLVKSDGGGSAILWQNSGDSIKTRFVDLRIENCHLYKCERNGINSRGYTNRKNWHPSIGVIIRNNLLEQIPGDGIVPIGCDGALIEYNVMRDCPDVLSHKEAAAGIWPWSSDNTLIQYNEVAGHKAKWDGQGFDSDWNCLNTTIQYNYSHDNYGGFLLVCNNGNNINTERNAGTKNTTIRYNVSVNDGIRPYPTERRNWFSPLMHITGPVEATSIYNNVFIVPPKSMDDIDKTLVEMDNWGGPWPNNTLFANNIFYVSSTNRFVFKEDENTTFSHNAFFGDIKNLPTDSAAIFKNPAFIDVSARGDGFDMLKNFMLQKGSPLVDQGILLDDEMGKDIFGNTIQGNVNIGIHEF